MVAPLGATVPPEARPRSRHDEHPAVLLDRARFGMLVYLTSKTMIFVALIGAFIVLAHAHHWPPATGPQLSIQQALPGTALLAISAMTILISTRGIKRGDQRATIRGLALTGVLGLAFAALQVAEWRWLYLDGLARSNYGQFYFVMTAFHMLYIVTGLGMMAVVLRRALLGRYDSQRYIGVDLCGLWWHFCGGVWVMLLTAIYVMPGMINQ